MEKVQISVLSLLLIGGLFSNKVVAQDLKVGGFYVDVNLGYNFSAAAQNTDTLSSYSVNSTGAETKTHKVVTGSLGKGMRFGANVGYLFNGNIGAELGVNYLLGSTISNESRMSSATSGFEFNSTLTNEASARMLQFNPSIVLSTGNEGFSPYAKLGVVIGVATKINISDEVKTTNKGANYTLPSNSLTEGEAAGGIALGWSAALGAKYALNETISLFGEINLINLSYSPTKAELIKFTEDGVNKLTGLTTGDKEWEFVDEVTTISSSTPDKTKPSKVLKENYSFSTIGIQVGLKIAF